MSPWLLASTTFALVLGLACMLFVLAPLASAKRAKQSSVADGTDALDAPAGLAMDSLRDLELDFRLGNLTPEDYTTLRTRYEDRVLASRSAQRPTSRADRAVVSREPRNSAGKGTPAPVAGRPLRGRRRR